MTINVERLREVQENIKNHPEHFDMSYWYKDKLGTIVYKTPKSKEQMLKCGTTACIAGWLCIGENLNDGADIATRAREIVGCDTYMLFNDCYWPEQFLPVTPESAIARIDHFIATDGRE